MNDRLQQNLEDARAWLLVAQYSLARCRRNHFMTQPAEAMFLRALDRVWEAQCMANASWR